MRRTQINITTTRAAIPDFQMPSIIGIKIEEPHCKKIVPHNYIIMPYNKRATFEPSSLSALFQSDLNVSGVYNRSPKKYIN